MKLQRSIFQIILIVAVSLLILAKSSHKQYYTFSSSQELQTFLSWDKDKAPLISAHRGGPAPGFPENALETFENIISLAPCTIECDVRTSKDSVLLMMHDETLDRTTTGTGMVEEYTWEQLKQLYLRDNDGRLTGYRIPTLAAALKWAAGKTILSLDIKRGISAEKITAMLTKVHAESYVIIITYNIEDARYYHRLNPRLVISVSSKGIEGTKKLLDSGISKRNLTAFVGVYEPPLEVYRLLHKEGIRAILGTMGNLDRQAETQGLDVYIKLLRNGADILATDNVLLAAKAIKKFVSTKRQMD